MKYLIVVLALCAFCEAASRIQRRHEHLVKRKNQEKNLRLANLQQYNKRYDEDDEDDDVDENDYTTTTTTTKKTFPFSTSTPPEPANTTSTAIGTTPQNAASAFKPSSSPVTQSPSTAKPTTTASPVINATQITNSTPLFNIADEQQLDLLYQLFGYFANEFDSGNTTVAPTPADPKNFNPNCDLLVNYHVIRHHFPNLVDPLWTAIFVLKLQPSTSGADQQRQYIVRYSHTHEDENDDTNHLHTPDQVQFVVITKQPGSTPLITLDHMHGGDFSFQICESTPTFNPGLTGIEGKFSWQENAPTYEVEMQYPASRKEKGIPAEPAAIVSEEKGESSGQDDY